MAAYVDQGKVTQAEKLGYCAVHLKMYRDTGRDATEAENIPNSHAKALEFQTHVMNDGQACFDPD